MDSTNTSQPLGQGALPATDTSQSEASLHEQISMIERATQAAHAAIDRFAGRAEATIRRVRGMANQASTRLHDGRRAYVEWEDRCVEDGRERIRARPLTAVAVGVVAGLLIGRMTRR
ncbi:hypothetical protein GTZ97_15950 [Aquabacterium fontiphilum]|jgi:ElaB/YqjD/DUF883 family membrane-anchored ribosome-binding protein|uniref:hypothetical protein n=1 Tax=Aquabacterium fontiphilum TaxID=450365 RepID=UPI0013769FAC|nr:hypothetical protein [Aquabacterium fontiphilum]NBD22153.1 hypothetical protein [Aquabacterium fontiphilum]